eukprot:6214191-Pleurochrysis_carterae.AAC.2
MRVVAAASPSAPCMQLAPSVSAARLRLRRVHTETEPDIGSTRLDAGRQQDDSVWHGRREEGWQLRAKRRAEPSLLRSRRHRQCVGGRGREKGSAGGGLRAGARACEREQQCVREGEAEERQA